MRKHDLRRFLRESASPEKWESRLFPGWKEYAMNTSTTDEVVIELADECQPAEILAGWVDRTSDID
jgi:hypothetical protein